MVPSQITVEKDLPKRFQHLLLSQHILLCLFCSLYGGSMCQRTRGPLKSLKNISDQILYKKTHQESKVDVNPTSSKLMYLLLRFNIASPIITYHPCCPQERSTPWLPIPCLHLSHLGLFAIVLPRNQLNPPLQRSAIRASEDWDLHLSSHVDFCWFILVFWTVSSGGFVWWMDGSLWPPTTCVMTLVGIIRFYTCLNLILWIIRFWGLACQKSTTVLLTVIPKYHHHSPSWWGSLQSLQAPFFQTPGSVSGQGTHENVPSGVRNQSCVA